ncbi:MAG: AAA family ATPase, partial [Deltaproteobacteria bacterium]|nr:AAA family ATPase [Deltaproteobacteria bacterium]
MLEFPSEGQSFPQIRSQNLLYVDKTKYFYPMLKKGGCYFLSRPRRFGKSLIIGALAELLKGNRELFKGLWIDSSDYDFKKYPVVTLSMVGEHKNEAALEASLINRLQGAARENGLRLADLDLAENSPPGDILDGLVSKLCSDENTRVAILIDEYDAPIQKAIGDVAQAEINRGVLSGFYSSVKALADAGKTHLVFVTGVTKFAKASIFSGFNNLSDLTLDSEYNAICGFTLEEFQSYFLDYLPGILERYKSNGFMPPEADLDYLIEEIIGYYDGYSWDGETRVLNSYSLIQALAKKKLKAYWFSSGAPSFLMKFLKIEGSGFSFPENPQMDETSLDAVDIKNLQLTPLLFQTGYLTIDKKLSDSDYLLRRPN